MSSAMHDLSLSLADAIANAALARGEEIGAQPLTVAVLDRGGHLIVLKRADGSGILRVEIAVGKAWGSLGMGFSSRAMAARAEKNPTFFNALFAASSGRVVPVPGGVLVRASEGGALLGAVGVSGDTSDVDEQCAVAAIEAAGLFADIAIR